MKFLRTNGARLIGLSVLGSLVLLAALIEFKRSRELGAMIKSSTDLLTLYEEAGSDGWRKARISTRDQWQAKRNDIRKRVIMILGRFPDTNPPLNPEAGSPEETLSYFRRKVSYASVSGDRITAWLLVPKTAAPKNGYPAVLAAHETDPTGKDSAVGLSGNQYVHYGSELAERGFVVLAPDSITMGERVLSGAQRYVTGPFDRENPEWSAVGKMSADHRRGIDYLLSLDFVNPHRIGAIGHSLGAINSVFLAAFDERVRAVVVSCGLSTLAGSSKPFAWSRSHSFIYFPGLAPYLRSGIAPFDFHEVFALLAPKPLFNYSAMHDEILPDATAIRAAAEQVRQVYRLLQAEERFELILGNGSHSFPEAVRKQAYGWLQKHLSAEASFD